MKKAAFQVRFDLDITLRDAALDADNRPTRRMIANAAIGMNVEDAYYSVRELREAVSWVHEGVPAGKSKLAEILANDGADDFQRCIYFCLAGRGVVTMLDDLEWLEDLLERRGRIAGEVMRQKGSRMPLTNPYVADAPDGPLVRVESDFVQGPSWWADPTLDR
ncbi:hypothetical protein AWL63_23530 (plasmid) [Sphingomonas panacis]|uniref:Uncharacterized protein n=1 Tax=Sphingomonas panacis TaxID=1560345 RepID=A0A1B3ZIB1_9SPHN|nr:hypothetical protein [Sphingomonas panacis]AOH87143.1 hypothetical protein AWL63_23530 [Sphingomonas panacis]